MNKMYKEKFNHDWFVSKSAGESIVEAMKGENTKKKAVHLPYDSMIQEQRDPNTKNAGQTGYYPSGIYYYTKTFFAPEEWKDKKVVLEFEGVQGITQVFVNEDFVGKQYNGYSSLYLTLNDFLIFGQENEIKVVANNAMELNSRWYTGSGIYRDVYLYVGESLHIPVNGVKVHTPEVNEEIATVIIETTIVNDFYKSRKVQLQTQVKDRNGQVVAQDQTPVTMYGKTTEKIRQRVAVTEPHLWDCENPNLYLTEVTLVEEETQLDAVSERFGIRSLQLSAAKGLTINGKQVKLRGTCLHHDNGIIGANTLRRAEQRRCEQLKAAGFNAIRSAHNPLSKTMLEICDELGILVMDELTDVWNRTKNIHDYANHFENSWEEDLEKMISKDFNHPSVIIYSLGNEIQEAGTPKGAQQNRKMANRARELDDTRYITNGINGILALGEKMGTIVGELMQYAPEMETPSDQQDADGSNELNAMMSVMLGDFADAIATHPIMDDTLDEVVEAMDIAGYNYLTGRHEREHQLYPNRVILGTETFPSDIANLWRVVEENNHVLGDLTWTGYDYLGEAAVAMFHYDGQVNFNPRYPDRTAYCGDIDLIGYRRPISYYREIVYGLRKEPYIGVERVNRYGKKSSLTPWMWKDNIASWTWPGYEGKPAIVNVCSDAQEVELVLNGESLGKKPAGKTNKYVADFELDYAPGELKAIAYRDGKPSETFVLQTADESVKIHPVVDRDVIQADGEDLAFVTINFVDDKGLVNLGVQKKVSVAIEGVGTLLGFGSANPSSEGNYFDTTCETYDGQVMAVVRSSTEKGTITVHIEADGCEATKLIVETI